MSDEEGHDMAMPATALPDPAPETIEQAFEELAVPRGFRAELIEGEIVVTPPPDGNHEHVLSRVNRQVIRESAAELDWSGNSGVRTPGGRFVPDGTVVRNGGLDDRRPWDAADCVELVVEVTSGTGDRDRVAKRRGYAAAGVPLYLLIDRAAREVVLYAALTEGDYHGQLRQPFGKAIDLPEPLSFTLDTSEFG